MSKGWDNLTLKKLKSLVGKGLSTSEIGRRLGMSKNAVVGKLNRMGWNATATATTTKTTKTKTTTVKTKKAATVATKTKTATKEPAKKSTTKAPAKKTVTKATPKKTAAKKATVAKPATKVDTTKPKKESKSSEKNLAMHQRIIQHSLEMANLKPNQCRWPIGDPDSENFHFCGKTVFTGKPYCYEHCRLAYQFTPPKKKQ